MNFIINYQLNFLESLKNISSPLNSLVKYFSQNNFKNLSQGFDNKVSDLVKQKEFYPYEYMSDFEKFKEELPDKEKYL